MRRLGIVLGCVCVMALLMMGALGGCGEQQQETEMPAMTDQGPGPADTAPDEDAEAPETDESAEMTDDSGEAPSGDAKKLADVMKKWPESFIMTARVTDKNSGQTNTSTHAMKLSGTEPLKIKTQMQGGGMILDHEDRVMYSWDASSDTATKMAMPEMEDSAETPYGEVNPDTKITGSETVSGVDCYVTETTEDGSTVKTWVAKDNGLMHKMEAPDVTVEYEYEQIGSVPDSEFQVPEGLEIQEVERPQMPDMGDMPDMPEDMPGR